MIPERPKKINRKCIFSASATAFLANADFTADVALPEIHAF
jgi:hypothetical protein